jgi:predicted DNA-binding transcriptional regulator AlpA
MWAEPVDNRCAGIAGHSRVTIVIRMDGDFPRLVGAHEIRSMLGVSRQRVYQLAARPDFPKPIAHLAQGKVWSVDDIEAWMESRRGVRRPPSPDP